MLNRFIQGNAGPTAPETDVAATAQARLDGRAHIVDVREPEEWAEGRIQDAIHIPLGDLAARTAELDPAQPVITVCRSGMRSLTAAETLIKAGFADAKSMAGGMIEWAGKGEPVERG